MPTDDRHWVELSGPSGSRVVLEEDECGAAFAYLLHDQEIVGDVWLYNVEPAPLSAPWTQPGAHPPFMNPAALSKTSHERRDIGGEVSARWSPDGAVDVFIGDRHEARLWPGAKPGQSFMAADVGPLASPLSPRTES